MSEDQVEKLEAENLALNKYVDELLEEPRALKKRIMYLEDKLLTAELLIEELEIALRTYQGD